MKRRAWRGFAGLLLFALGQGACLQILGGDYDADWTVGAGGAAGSGGTTASTSNSTSSTSSTVSTGGTGGAPCTDPATQCPDPGTACINAVCDMGACATQNANAGTTCTDNNGKVCDGNGACVECADPTTDCPNPGTECILATCTAGACGTTDVADLTPTTGGQTAKDCKQQVCDGNGGEKLVNDDSDTPDPMDACHVAGCDNGNGTQTPAVAGTTCNFGGGKICDNAGSCVECNTNTDCAAPNPICTTAHVCVATGCTDQIKNGTESDVDCGGSCGATCVIGELCNTGADCLTGVCNGTCTTAECNDGVKNGSETGPDCGGPCVAQGKLCAVGVGCTQPTDCVTGACNGTTCVFKAQGTACNNHGECGAAGSNLCVDGFCCNSSCGNGCQACSAAKKGSGGDGVCGNIGAGVDPNNFCSTDLPSTCANTGVCDGAGACAKHPTGTVCRAAVAGGCDVAETCPGAGAACPTDLFAANSVVCRVAAAGGCDVAENCTGTSAACPADGFAPSTTVCRAAVAGGCDVAETCTGTSAACPTDAFLPSTTVCRGVAGACDVPENCTGTSAACPTDTFLSSSTVCRPAVDPLCDLAENCDGLTKDCPADVVKPANTICRASTGVCDQEEICGGANTCPANAFFPATQVCRTAADACDVAENCDGSTKDCPTNAFQSSGTSCGAGALCSGNTLTSALTCDGGGLCGGGVPAACSGNLICQNGTSCWPACSTADPTGDAKCVSTHYCGGAGGCTTKITAGNACTRNGECAGPATASCSGSTLTPAASCTASLCAGAAACANNLVCASATACETACGTDDAAGDAKCVATHYCSGGTTCATKLATGVACTRNTQCANGTCAASLCN